MYAIFTPQILIMIIMEIYIDTYGIKRFTDKDAIFKMEHHKQSVENFSK